MSNPVRCETLYPVMPKSTKTPPATSPMLGRPVGANSEETRKRILEATMRCVAEVGYARATIREIAREAQMTSGSLYHYFPNKAELVKATFDEVAAIAVPRLAQAAGKSDSVLDKLMAVLEESQRVIQDYPLAVAFDRAVRTESPQHLRLAEDSNALFGAFHDLIQTILEQGERDKVLGPGVDAGSAANSVFVIFRGLNEYARTAPPPEDYQATVEGLKKLLRGQLFDYRALGED